VKNFLNGKEVRFRSLIFGINLNVEQRRIKMGSTYKIIELVGTSDTSWEDAAKTAVETAGLLNTKDRSNFT
jgi:hypothetical protein